MKRRLIAFATVLVAVPAIIAYRSAKTKGSVAETTAPTAETIPTARIRELRDAIESGYASTLAAFTVDGADVDFEGHDARAKHDAEKLEAIFATIRPDLTPEIASFCEALVERVASAQLKLMAFAINRKNRGLPDSAQIETEIADRAALVREIEPLYQRLTASLG